MDKIALFNKLSELKQKFTSFFQHRKKVNALENFSGSVNFHHRKYLNLIKGCINDGFLDEKEEEFLEHMLKKYEINYLEWSHRTKWLKAQMAQRRAPIVTRPQPAQMFFNFDKKQQTPVEVPVEVLMTDRHFHQRIGA